MSEGTTATEYAAVRNGGAGLVDLSSRGRILVSGSDAPTFLNGLITNDTKALEFESWMPAAFPNVQGRLLAAARVIRRDDGFLIDTEAATHERVFTLLERFTPAGDFRVKDLTRNLVSYSVQGKKAPEIVRAVLGQEAVATGNQVRKATLGELGGFVIRATHTAEVGFDFFIDAHAPTELRTALIDAGAQAVSEEVTEILRIEAGIARYGIDMDETNVVTETNLDDAVSFTKGCYIGQEIIVRIKHRGHVAKKLTGVMLETRWDIEAGAEIISDNHEMIGRITSSTFSPHLERTIALAYVKYDYLEPGTRIWIDRGEKEVVAEIASLPMVRGSWYQEL